MAKDIYFFGKDGRYAALSNFAATSLLPVRMPAGPPARRAAPARAQAAR